MKKRDFIKTGFLVVAGSISPIAKANFVNPSTNKIRGFNNAMPNYQASQVADLFSEHSFLSHVKKFSMNADLLLSEINSLTFQPKSVKSVVLNANNYNSKMVNRAVDHYNHKMFFKQFGKRSTPNGKSVYSAINSKFGSIQQLKTSLSDAAKSQEEGWVWLVYKNNRLEITALKGNKNPLQSSLRENQQGFPLIGIDTHAHCFAKDYQNDKVKYISNLVDALNWEYIERRYLRAQSLL